MVSDVEALDQLLDAQLLDSDPVGARALQFEEARQRDKLIMIPSESLAPRAVRQALGTVFTNLYAEGYASPRTLAETTEQLEDVEMQAAMYRRLADRRHYRGTEFADVVEALANRRISRLFATDGDPEHGSPVPLESIFSNVQALSGAAANNAVYEAVLQRGDTIMGMNLTHGGHLTHGSPYNRSGRYFNVVQYGVSPETGRLDYDEMERLAVEHKPRLIVVGASAYPWTFDWRRLRDIAHRASSHTLLMADMAHTAGLIVGKQFPNPIGYANIVTFTTHKTMLGPRGAVILTTNGNIAKRIDRAVFPGEQGGPHMNNIFAMAVAFKMAERPEFREIQRRIVANAAALAEGLKNRGMRLAYGGTNTHLLLIDLNAIKTRSGDPLKGDVAARILDMAGIVCNKNTIPGDLNAAYSSAVRLGTVWLTQRGADQAQMDRIAETIASLLSDIRTFSYVGTSGPIWRGKVTYPTLRAATDAVHEIAAELTGREGGAAIPQSSPVEIAERGPVVIQVRGPRAAAFLQEATTVDVLSLAPGTSAAGLVADGEGNVMAQVTVVRPSDGKDGSRFWLVADGSCSKALQDWLAALSDGYTIFERGDILAKVPGPVVVGQVDGIADSELKRAIDRRESIQSDDGGGEFSDLRLAARRRPDLVVRSKPYFVGRSLLGPSGGEPKPPFTFEPYAGDLRKSCLYDEHLKLTSAKNMVPFAGWSMPVWYTSIGEEHRAVRQTAGLFDVTHMGVLDVRGAHAARFLDLATSNYASVLRPGQTQYAFLLQPDGSVIDDILTYCLAPDHYMLVVNASNAEKDKAWLDAVNARAVAIDPDDPAREVDAVVQIRDLKDPSAGGERRVDISLQGPNSLAVLRKVMPGEAARRAIGRLRRSEFIRTTIAGVDAIVSRTGYTGEQYGYELYVNPDRAPEVWRFLLAEGAPLGLKPTGLGSRDSSRTEAGFPLYGHELAGPYDVTPGAAGYGSFVKMHKSFFIGCKATAQREAERKVQVVRFAVNARGVRMAKTGDPVVSKRGEMIGFVTSAVAIDGVQVGLAVVDRRYADEGAAVGIFPLPRERGRGSEPAKADLKMGDRLLLHEEATILSRFMAVKRDTMPEKAAGRS